MEEEASSMEDSSMEESSMARHSASKGGNQSPGPPKRLLEIWASSRSFVLCHLFGRRARKDRA